MSVLPRVVQVTRDEVTLTFDVRRYAGVCYWVAHSPGWGTFPLPLRAEGDESAAFFERAAHHVLRELGF